MVFKEKRWKIAPRKKKSIFDQLLLNRGISNLEEFTNLPSLAEIILLVLKEDASLKRGISIAKKLVLKAMREDRPIFIHGDYDVDGICATAVLWEKIYRDFGYKNCVPYIPDRFNEGYGLSVDSLDNILSLSKDKKGMPLIITVDCGIVSSEEVSYAKSKGFEVIICDHHQKKGEDPEADAVLWTPKLCGAGISWILSTNLSKSDKDGKYLQGIDLVALATISDVQSLTGYNRSLVKYGLQELNEFKRPGLQALKDVSGISSPKMGVYEIGWIIGPRLNASGRLDSALDSLRLLCTSSYGKARELAQRLNSLNSKRQELTFSMFEESKKLYKKGSKIILSESFDYHEGVIGLVAGKLVAEFHVPSVVISKKKDFSKGSARSIAGVNIVELLRSFDGLFESLGGHPMAAGFNIKTKYLDEFRNKIQILSEKNIKEEDIVPELKIDAELSLEEITQKLLEFIVAMEPFGFGNPEPVFLTKNVEVFEVSRIGKNKDHLRLVFRDSKGNLKKGVAFGFGDFPVNPKDSVDIAYTINENVWNDRRNIDLRLKDMRAASKF